VQDGRIHIELINGPFLFKDKGSAAEYGAGMKLALERGWLVMHESGTSCGSHRWARGSPDGASQEMQQRLAARRPHVVIGGTLFSSCETAVTSCAGDGFASMMLLGTPLDAHSSACAPLM